MANLIGGDRLRESVDKEDFIKGGKSESVENFKYDFHMGDRILKASFGQPIALSEVPQTKRVIDPGEVVFVLTQERLDLPNNIFATLVPKRKIAHSGIMVLGGFAIDPSYKGYVLLGLYNFSSTPFPLIAGKKVVAGLFYDITPEESSQTVVVPTPIDDFPDELIRLIAGYKPVELNGLSESLDNLRRELHGLREEVTTDKSWRDDFKATLQTHSHQIGDLLKSLTEERESRIKDDENMKSKLETMTNVFVGLKFGWLILAAVIGAVISWAVTKFL